MMAAAAAATTPQGNPRERSTPPEGDSLDVAASPALAKALREVEAEHLESKMESRRLSIEIRKREAAATLRENEINTSAHLLNVRRSQHNTPARGVGRLDSSSAAATPLSLSTTAAAATAQLARPIPAPLATAATTSTPVSARHTAAASQLRDSHRHLSEPAVDVQRPASTGMVANPATMDAMPSPIAAAPKAAPTSMLMPTIISPPEDTAILPTRRCIIAGVTESDSAVDFNMPASPILGSRAQRDRIRLGQQRLGVRPRSRILLGGTDEEGATERPIRRHTTASTLSRPAPRHDAPGAVSSVSAQVVASVDGSATAGGQPTTVDKAVEILKRTTGETRDYTGYSLSYMMNQEVQHGASELKVTGAVLT